MHPTLHSIYRSLLLMTICLFVVCEGHNGVHNAFAQEEGGYSKAPRSKPPRKVPGTVGFVLTRPRPVVRKQTKELRRKERIGGKDPSKELQNILRRKEFQNTKSNQQANSMVERFATWVKTTFKKLFGFLFKKPKKQPTKKRQKVEPPGWMKSVLTFFSSLVGGIVNLFRSPFVWGVLIALVLFFLVRLVIQSRGTQKSTSIETAEGEEEEPEIDLRERTTDELRDAIERFAKEGNFREAIRHVYWLLLLRLHHMGVLYIEPNTTNHAYLSRLRRSTEAYPLFSELLARFERTWYGLYPCDRNELVTCEGLVESILSLELPKSAIDTTPEEDDKEAEQKELSTPTSAQEESSTSTQEDASTPAQEASDGHTDADEHTRQRVAAPEVLATDEVKVRDEVTSGGVSEKGHRPPRMSKEESEGGES